MEWRAIVDNAGNFRFAADETLCHLTFVPVTKLLIFDPRGMVCRTIEDGWKAFQPDRPLKWKLGTPIVMREENMRIAECLALYPLLNLIHSRLVGAYGVPKPIDDVNGSDSDEGEEGDDEEDGY